MGRAGPADWIAEQGGLRFECTQCGNCCSGPPGSVVFTEAEAQAIAEALGLSCDAFLMRFTRHESRVGGGRSLKEVETEHGWDCVFLDRRSVPGKAVCSIYHVRPTQCRTFPWWPGNIESRRHWDRLGRTCEGVNRGRLVPPEEIMVALTIHERDVPPAVPVVR